MKRSNVVGWIAGLALGLIAAPLASQTTVHGAVVIQSGPGDNGTADRARRVIGHEREVVVVQRIRGRGAWWKRPGYRTITVYYDGRSFYRRPFAGVAFRRVVIYERAGRYYVDEKQWKRYGKDWHDHEDDHHDHGNHR